MTGSARTPDGPSGLEPEAAESRRDEQDEPTPRQRLARALIQPGKGQVIGAVLLLVLGFGAVIQLRARGTADPYQGARQSDLVTLLNSLSLSTSRIQREITRLTQTRDSLETDSNAKQTALNLAQQQETTLSIIAGTIPVTGPGVRVTIHDPTSVVSVETLLNGVSELRDAGAEAIAINGTRVVASTAFQQDSQGDLMVGGNTLKTPYVIDVIGDPQTLKSAVSFEGGFAFEVRAAGARLAVRTSDSIEIAAVASITPSHYASAAPSE